MLRYILLKGLEMTYRKSLIVLLILLFSFKGYCSDSVVKFLRNKNVRISNETADFIVMHINNYSSKYNIDPNLVASIIYVESKFNVKAVNGSCIGLMQVNYSVWRKDKKFKCIISTKNDLLDAEKNIHAGIYILSHYINKSNGNIKSAIIRYSGGSKKYGKKVYNLYLTSKKN